ncbi:MAG: cytochrome c3 family protein [Burkholderiales bacterium]|nr:cytochrome c3 family protein [Burkholderiales bacterium]MBY0576264.1 cytochrome c3 family protein [Gallionellaceae bacterium]
MAILTSRKALWIYWGVLTLAIGAYLALGLLTKGAGSDPWLKPARVLFLPGQTSHGHYQIELACESCHTDPLGGKDVLQDACVNCHGAELKEADDKHPKSKFTDPRNADRVARIDATNCVTCHAEHKPEITAAMGVTVPRNFCAHCHSGENDIGKERPSHAGMDFGTCADAGCHNFHDNRALYEDFLLRHRHEPDLLAKMQLPARDFAAVVRELPGYPADRYPLRQLDAGGADAPAGMQVDQGIVRDWLATAHARAGVNCSACHQAPADGGARWTDHPDHKACAGCHQSEVKGFLAGKHGMRLDQGLPAMKPGMARLAMKAGAADKTLGCTSCHGAHRFDTRRAAVEGCLACHNDRHSLAYRMSPHYALWLKEMSGEAPPGSGVACASCHLPRIAHKSDDVSRMLVQHNQNDNLRPSEKMIRPVCMNCHGLGFTLDALADPGLVAGNFNGRPSRHVQSLDMAERRERELKEKKRGRNGG